MVLTYRHLCHQMDGSADVTTTHASHGFVVWIAIHAMVVKDKSFYTQRMLAHGIQAPHTTA